MDPANFPTLLEPRTLFFFALFVVPGWLARLFYRRYVPQPPTGFGLELLDIVSLSLLLFAPSGLVLAVIAACRSRLPLLPAASARDLPASRA